MRSCGNCTLCCKLLGLKESKKVGDVGTYCSFCDKNVGCTIYEDRGPDCENFNCLWLSQTQIPDSYRPDKLHVMFELPAASLIYIGHVDPDYPDAWKNINVHIIIDKINKAGHSVILVGKDFKNVYLGNGMTKEDVYKDLNNCIKEHIKHNKI